MNIANAQERLGLCREAAASLEQFAATLPENDAQRPTLQRRIENLRARADQREAEQREREEREAREEHEESTSEASAATTPADATVASTTTGSDGLLVPSLVAFGVGAAGLATFGVLGGLALLEEGRVRDDCGRTQSCSAAEVQTMDDLALGADIALAVGVAAVATGAVLLAIDPPRDGSSDTASARVVPFGHPRGAGLAVQGAF